MAARAQDLTFTRELLRERLAASGRVVLNATEAARALGVDEKALRAYGDDGLIDYVRKGKLHRCYTVEAILDFLARGGVPANHGEGEGPCRSTSRRARGSTTTASSAEVVTFTGRRTARPAAPPKK